LKIFSNDDMQRALKMPAVVDVLRTMYTELGHGRVTNRLRSDIYCATPEGGVYCLKSMDGVVPKLEVGAIRINSDIITWIPRAGGLRKEKVPAAPGDRWVGLILLFSTRTGEPLAIMPDGYIQRMRVGGASGIALDLMARRDAKVVSVFGTGWQAGAQLLAACAVREFAELRAYSPNPEHRKQFQAEMREELGRDIVIVDSPEALVDGTDVILLATNSIDPVLRAEWIKPGMHIATIRSSDLERPVYDLPMRIVMHGYPILPQDLVTEGTPHLRELDDNKTWYKRHDTIAWDELPTLGDLLTGQAVGRASDDEITCYFNLMGTGAQFAAVAAKLLELTRETDIGHDVPGEWFTQTEHP
jgi:alanine dehydrogenase